MKSKRKLVPSAVWRMAEVTDTAPAVQSSVAMLVTHHLTTTTMPMSMMMMMTTTTTTSSGKMVVGMGEIGEFGKWSSCANAFFHVVAGIHVPAPVRPGTPHGSDDAQPSGEGPQPWDSHRLGCVGRKMLV